MPAYHKIHAVIVITALLVSLSAQAAGPYYWDNNGAVAGFGAAAGTWAAPTTGNATQGWSTDSTGATLPVNQATETTDSINFGNGATVLGAGTITVSGTVNSGDMTFASGSGAIVLSGGTAINLAAATTITLNNASDTISTALTGAGTSLTKAGNGTLTLGTSNAYAGATNINGGFIQVSGITNTLGSGTAGTVNLNGGGIIAAWTTQTTAAWSINVGSSGGSIEGSGSAGRFIFSANKLTGSGTLTLKSSGSFNRFTLASSQTSFTGKYIVDGTGGAFLLMNSTDANLGATPGSFTADAVTLINNAQIAGANAAGSTVGSATRGIAIGTGGGKFAPSGMNIFQVLGAISSTGTDQIQIANTNNSGGGVRFINASNSYSGDTNVIQGGTGTTVLQLGASEVLPNGTGKGNLLLNSVGVLDLNSFNETINGLSGNSTSYVVNSVASTQATLTIGDNGTTSTFAGVIQDNIGSVPVANATTGGALTANTGGTTAITKIGNGTLTLSGNNSYSGGTTINSGTISVNSATSLGSAGGNLTFAGNSTIAATANITSSRNYAINSGVSGTVDVATSSTFSNNGTISGLGTLVKAGNGTLTLTGNNSYSGGTTVSNGTLAVSGSGTLGSPAAALNVAGGILDLEGTSQTAGTVTINSTIQNGTLSGTSFDGQNGTISAALSGSGALAKTTAGTLTLSGNSSYSGGTTVSAGSLVVSNNNALGSGNVTLNSSNGTNSGVYRSSLTLSGVTVTGKTVTMNSTTNRAGLVATGAGGGTWNGTVTLSGSTSGNGNSEFTNVTGNGPLTVLGIVNGSFTSGGLTLRGDNANNVLGASVSIGSTPIIKTDAGAWKITSSGNAWGTTDIQNGTLRAGAANALPTGTVVSIGSGNNNGTLDLGSGAGSYSQTIGGLSTAAATNPTSQIVTNSSNSTGTATLTVNTTTSNTFGGVIQDGAGGGVISLTKSGSGTQVLSGNNTYTGLTTVSAGALNIGSGGRLASGNALTLGATGTANIANVGQTLGTVTNNNTAANALNFSALTGTVTLASLSGAGNSRFGSNGTVTGGISNGTVTSFGALTADITGGTITAGGLLTGNITSGTVGVGSLSAATVSGGTNTVTGAATITTLSNGTTTIGGVVAIGTMTAGTANLNGTTSAITTLNGGTIQIGNSTVLTVSTGATSGTISGGGSLTKATSSTLFLSGNNTYTGSTTVSVGALVVNGSLASSSLAVESAGTLGGTGAIAGDTTIAGTHNPGNSPGIQSFGGNLTYSGGSSVVNWELSANTNVNAANPNAIFDTVVVAGNLSFNGVTNLNLSFKPVGGNVIWSDPFWKSSKTETGGWLVYDVAGTISSFSNLHLVAANWQDSGNSYFNTVLGGSSFSLYQNGSKIYLKYTTSTVTTPEPSSGVAMAVVALLGGAVFLIHRRSRWQWGI